MKKEEYEIKMDETEFSYFDNFPPVKAMQIFSYIFKEIGIKTSGIGIGGSAKEGSLTFKLKPELSSV